MSQVVHVGTSAIHRVQTIVDTHPDLVALEVGERRLTYHELWQLSGAVAALIDRAEPKRVGLCAAGSVSAYAGYLAAQRLGATVVPMNPGFPLARNLAIAENGEVDMVLMEPPGDGPLADALRAQGHPVLVAPGDVRTADDLSTAGRSDGVPARHRGVFLDLELGCRVSQPFDPDVLAIWSAGATLVVPTEDDLLMPSLYVAQRQITHWCSASSVVAFAHRIRALPPGAMPSLRRSVFVGEPLTSEQTQAWAAAAPNSVIADGNGPY